jgi:perosamine synthetase
MTPFLFRKEPHFSARYLTFSRQSPAALAASLPSLRLQFFWARNAIYHGLRLMGISPSAKVLVPAYLCKAAIQPIEACGGEPTFYAVHRDCGPDFTDLESKIDDRTRVVMAVHHFGLPRGFDELRRICDRRGVLLLEDCAHVLQVDPVEEPLGTLGDASVFSWRKFLPLYDGGELLLNHKFQKTATTIRWQHESLLFTLKAGKNLLEEMLSKRLSELAPEGEVESKDYARESNSIQKPKSALHVDRNDPEFLEQHVNFPMSRISRLLFKHVSLAKIAAKRRRNYLYLKGKLSEIPGVRTLDEQLPDAIVPWTFPVFIGESPNTHKTLRELGIPAVSWGGVRHSKFSPREYPAADFLYENLVFLPIHQDLDESGMDLIVAAVKKVRRAACSTISITNA